MVWDLLYLLIAGPYERRLRQQQAAQAARREEIAAERVAQGYRRVTVRTGIDLGIVSSFAIGSLLPSAEEKDWFVPERMAQYFESARGQALTNYNELVDNAWNRYVSGEIFSFDYRRLCETAQHAYQRNGEAVERALVARGTSPNSARFAREHFYDYNFPYVSDQSVLLFDPQQPAAGRGHSRSAGRTRPMRDVTPPQSQLGGRSTRH